MIKWLIVGLVVWYFYRRFNKRKEIKNQRDPRYIRDDDFRTEQPHGDTRPIDEDDYIDYEEVK